MRKIRVLLLKILMALFGTRHSWIKDEPYNKLAFFIAFGRRADFDHPRTFNEYVCARKVRLDEYGLWKYTDKYEARNYVEKKIGSGYLNEIFGVYDSFEEIDFSMLPDRFVLKMTHGSAYNMVIADKKTFDFRKAARQFGRWEKENYYYKGREKNYFNISPRILCERFIEPKKEEGLTEVKVFCFGGKAKFLSYNCIVNGKVHTNVYDQTWKRIDVRRGYPAFEPKSLPANRDDILRIAQKLAEPFDFVRVDLYDVDEKILFSELTFHSGGGFVPFDPPKYDFRFAQFFRELEG
jgi:hypothetical protein